MLCCAAEEGIMELRRRKREALSWRRQGVTVIDRRFAITARCALYFILGLVLSFSRVLETGAPLGMAFVASAGCGLTGVSALAGAAIGYLAGGLDWGIRYVAAAVLVYTVSFVFHELKISRSAFFMPTAAGLVMLLAGYLGSFASSSDTVPIIAKLFLETFLAFGGCYFFLDALSHGERSSVTAELKHSAAVMITAACVLMALSRIVVLGTVSVGRVAALILLMTSSLKGGMLTGAAVGTVMGIAMDAALAASPFYTMAYAFSGLLSGVFGKPGRVIFLLSFVLSMALAVIMDWNDSIYLSALFETFSASVIFMLLPNELLSYLGLMLQAAEKGSGESGLRRFTAGRVRGLAEAYSELYETVERSLTDNGNDENIASVFDRAADNVCAECRNKNRCWNTDYMDTLSALNDATEAMRKNGVLSSDDIPSYFTAKCCSSDKLVGAINTELKAMAYRRQLRVRLRENKTVAWGQFQDMAQLLGGVSQELGSINGADPLAERRLMRYLKNLDIDADASVFRDGSGRLRAVIESGNLTPLLNQQDYLLKLREVLGVRVCRENESADCTSRLKLIETEPLAVTVGIAAMKKRGETVSGDKGSCFKTDFGVLCIILSDGMGTGDCAAKDSERTVAILEKLIRSGADPALAMKMLNSVMLLRDGEEWGYATVDLICVNLFTGETCFYKYGAAPSFVKSGKTVKRIKGEKLPVGLNIGEGRAPDVVRMQLKAGSCAMVISDGVISDGNDRWIKELMSQEWVDMKTLARAAVKESEQLYGVEDDMTVLALRIEERL